MLTRENHKYAVKFSKMVGKIFFSVFLKFGKLDWYLAFTLLSVTSKDVLKNGFGKLNLCVHTLRTNVMCFFLPRDMGES